MNDRTKLGLSDAIVCCVLVAATLLVYWPVMDYDFTNYDDNVLASENPIVLKGLTLDSVSEAFGSAVNGHWHPLTILSYMADFELYGVYGGGFHTTNLQFHLLNTLLLFVVMRRFTGNLWPSALFAALFALHPLHVEPVAWIASRKDMLSTFFLALSLLVYAGYVERPSLWKKCIVVLLFAMGLISKAILITFPVMLLLLDYWPLGRFASDGNDKRSFAARTWQLAMEKLSLFVLSAMSVIITIAAAHGTNTMGSVDTLPFWVRCSNAVVSCWIYVIKLFWPANLSPYYPHPGDSLSKWLVAAAVAGLVVVTLAAFALRKRFPYILVGWLWFGVTLLPVSGLLQAGSQAWADRYTYLSYMGLFFIVCWGISEIVGSSRTRRFAASATVIGLLAALAVCSAFQLRHWRDSVTLFEHALSVTDNNHVAHNNLAHALSVVGDHEDKVLKHYVDAVRVKPGFAPAHAGLGNLFYEREEHDEAIKHFRIALGSRPEYVLAHLLLAQSLHESGETDKALEEFAEVLRLDPGHAKAHNYLGKLLAERGQMNDAFLHFERANALEPQDAETLSNLGAALAQLKRVDDAIVCFERAVVLDPLSATARYNLAVALDNQGRIQEAVVLYRQVLSLNPDHKDAANNLSLALRKLEEN